MKTTLLFLHQHRKKGIWFGILTGLVITMVIALAAHKESARDRIVYAQFLPEETLFYINQRNLGNALDIFKRSKLAEIIESIDLIRIALDIGISLDTIEQIRQTQEMLSSPRSQMIFQELLSKEFALALFSDEEGGISEVPSGQNLLFFSQPKHGSNLIKLLDFSPEKKENTIRSQYGKHNIHRMRVAKDISISYVVIDHSFLFAINEITLRKALDRYDQKSHNLSQKQIFNTLREKYKNADTFCFFSTGWWTEQGVPLVHRDDIGSLPNSFLKKALSGFTHGAYGAWYKKMSIEDSLTLSFNKRRLSEYAAAIFQTKPENDQWLKNVPADVLLYYWTNTLNLPLLWDIYSNDHTIAQEEKEALTKIFSELSENSASRISPLLGKKISIIIKEPSLPDPLPFPNVSMFLQVKDIYRFRAILNTIVDQSEIPHNIVSYREKEITFWGDEVKPGLQPAFTFNDNTLIVSTSVALIKEILDTAESGNSLLENKEFQISATPLLLNNNFMGFMQFVPMVEILKDFLRMSGAIAVMQNRETAVKTKILIDQVLMPMLDGLKIFSAIAARSYIDDGVLIIESKKTFLQ